MTLRITDTGQLKTLAALSCAVLFFFIGCVGGKGFHMEIETGNDSSQRIQELAEKQMNSDLPAKELPEITGDEYERMGDALLGQKKLYLAYVQYEKSLELNPGNLSVEYKKGLALLMSGKNEDAIMQFQVVLDQEPNFAPAYEGIGQAYFQKKEYDRAEKDLLKAVVLDPKLWKSYIYIGYICDHRKDYKNAVYQYNEALKVNSGNGLIYNNLGVSYSLSGNYTKAVAAFHKAIKLNYREGKVYNNLALALANLERYDEALETFKKVGSEAQAYNNMGCIYMSRGMFEDAIISFEKAIELEPGYYAKAGDNLKKAKVLRNRNKTIN
jgi:Flp pilus assembly protein TadD